MKLYKEKYIEIDMECAKLEDSLHGSESKQISYIRKLLKEYNDKAILTNEEIGKIADDIILCIKGNTKESIHNSIINRLRIYM
jgi:hypothetical protein